MVHEYAFGVPSYVILLLHVVVGLILLYVGSRLLDGKKINRNIILSLIVMGSLSPLYHTHVYFFEQ